jgi:hypothetical protein
MTGMTDMIVVQHFRTRQFDCHEDTPVLVFAFH